MLNKEILLNAKQSILEEPLRLRMGTWLRKINAGDIDSEGCVNFPGSYYGEPSLMKVPSCNTVGCVALWVCVAALGNEKALELGPRIEETAEQLVNHFAVDYLFHPQHWHAFTKNDDDYFAYLAAKTPEVRAEIVGKMIDRFIEVYEVRP